MEKFLLTVILCIMLACLFIVMIFKNNIKKMENSSKTLKASKR